MSSEKNLYDILEISHTASAVAIKSAYRKLARKYHPDLNSGDKECVKKFKEISQAYEILSDAEKKKHYDILKGLYQETSGSKFNEAEKAYKEEKAKSKKEKEDVFSHIFNDILEGFKKTSQAQKDTFKAKQAAPERGSDVYTDITINLTEALNGTTRTINILHSQICPNCMAKPFMNGTKCPICGGVGEQSIHKKLNVKIPPNVKHGSKIRIANEGNKGYNGGRNGDLYLNIKVESDLNFTFEGLNVFSNISITPFEAVLGAVIEINSPNGKISMKITPNTHSGQKFRLAGQGLIDGSEKGDMIVTVTIDTPKNPSPEEIQLYERLKEASKTNLRENK